MNGSPRVRSAAHDTGDERESERALVDGYIEGDGKGVGPVTTARKGVAFDAVGPLALVAGQVFRP